uniref:synergin gamma isoform X3 n=1 Tax=Myxine glutinosa TaxID=7769 RepID=UPI00358F9DD2
MAFPGGAPGCPPGNYMFPVGGNMLPGPGMPPQQMPRPPSGFMMPPTTGIPLHAGMMGALPTMSYGGQIVVPVSSHTLPMQQFYSTRPPPPTYIASQQLMMGEQHKFLEQQKKMEEQERKRRQFEEQKQKLQMMSSAKTKVVENRDNALEAMMGNLVGFSRETRIHLPSTPQKNEPSHHTSAPLPIGPTAIYSSLPETSNSLASNATNDFTDFIQAPFDNQSSCSLFTNTIPQSSLPPLKEVPPLQTTSLPSTCTSLPSDPATLDPTSTFLPNVHAHRLGVANKSVKAPAITQPAAQPTSASSSSRDAAKTTPPAWLFNDSMVPGVYRHVLELTTSPKGIDTTRLYPLLLSSGLPRETLGVIWSIANRAVPGQLARNELFAMLALVAVAQSGLPVASLECLAQYPTPPVPTLNFPAANQSLSTSSPAHVVPISTVVAPPTISYSPSEPSTSLSAPFIITQAKVSPDSDEFQDFQGAAVTSSDSFGDFQAAGGSCSSLPDTPLSWSSPVTPVSSATCGPAATLPVSMVSTSAEDKYAVFRHIEDDDVRTDRESIVPDPQDKYSVLRTLGGQNSATGTSEELEGVKDVGDVNDHLTMAPILGDAGASSAAASYVVGENYLPGTRQDGERGLVPWNAVAEKITGSRSHVSATRSQDSNTSLTHEQNAPSIESSNFADFSVFAAFTSFDPVEEQSSVVSSIGQGFARLKPQALVDHVSKSQDILYKEENDVTFPDLQGPADVLAKPPAIMPISRFTSTSRDDCLSVRSLELPTIENAGTSRDDSDDGLSVASAPVRAAAGLRRNNLPQDDSSSVRSLELPPPGGINVRDDWDEAGSLASSGLRAASSVADLRHVLSDSSLDLPPAGQQQAIDLEDFGDGSRVSSLVGFDWTESESPTHHNIILKTDCKKVEPARFFLGQPKGFFENTTETVMESSESASKEIGTCEDVRVLRLEDHHSDKWSDDQGAPGLIENLGPDLLEERESGTESRPLRFDFPLRGHLKVRSSEEMIISELETFDLCVQDSRRGQSLENNPKGGTEKVPSPQKISSVGSCEKSSLPVIRDKYKDLTGEVEEYERYAYEWQRCLESIHTVIKKANNIFNGITSSAVCTEVMQSEQGMEYLAGVIEVYRVSRRVEQGIKTAAVGSQVLQQNLRDIDLAWHNLAAFLSLSAGMVSAMLHEKTLDFSTCVLKPGTKATKKLACGVCLLNVEIPEKTDNVEIPSSQLTYGRHNYHASCANFWINCVEPKPPGLKLPELL